MAKASEKPVWLKYTESELQKIIAELATKHTPSQVGIILRDQYGVPSARVYGKKLSHFLKKAGIETREDMEAVEKKIERLKEHLKTNITDKKAKHKTQKAKSRLNKLKRYYSKK